MSIRYRHKLTGQIVTMLSASNNRVIVKDVDTGSRLYFDWPDFRAIFREVSK